MGGCEMKALKRPGAGGFGQERAFAGKGGQGVIDFLRANEAQLAAMRAAKPSLRPAPEASGWGSTKAQLLNDVCRRVQVSSLPFSFVR